MALAIAGTHGKRRSAGGHGDIRIALAGMLTSALLASIYLETVTIKSGGTTGQLTKVFS